MSASATPQASSHAQFRLLQRAGLDARSVENAWRSGTPVEIEYRDYHTATYNEALDVILLEQGDVVTTILRAAFEEFTEGAQ
ncbi:hypothetical protein [Haloarcula amylovorans]|uniref:hypothetical protein n=1 Tax=Haloarcula amylovorans TaxID=2562280 RepID=UPI0010768DEA|nr:hypothetical protein [Halomicroarcula amylolytica]